MTTNNPRPDQQEEEDMRQAFAEFMLRPKSKPNNEQKYKSPSSPSHAITASPPPPSSSPMASANTPSNQVKKMIRKYWQIINAFRGTLTRNWLDIDDHLFDVMSSIADLRHRIVMEHSYLNKLQSTKSPQWHGRGFQSRSKSTLTIADVEMALSHDLRKHEQMMAGARMLLASLSEAQEALGRRLEELQLYHMDVLCMIHSQDQFELSSSLATAMTLPGCLEELFASLGEELYRKQGLVQTVLDTVHDDLLVDDMDLAEQEKEIDLVEGISTRVADKCCREWSRSSKYGNVRAELLEEFMMKTGDEVYNLDVGSSRSGD